MTLVLITHELASLHSWAAIFYLITTDILGPFNAPFAFSQVGYVPGAVLYVVSKCILLHYSILIPFFPVIVDPSFSDLGH